MKKINLRINLTIKKWKRILVHQRRLTHPAKTTTTSLPIKLFHLTLNSKSKKQIAFTKISNRNTRCRRGRWLWAMFAYALTFDSNQESKKKKKNSFSKICYMKLRERKKGVRVNEKRQEKGAPISIWNCNCKTMLTFFIIKWIME